MRFHFWQTNHVEFDMQQTTQWRLYALLSRIFTVPDQNKWLQTFNIVTGPDLVIIGHDLDGLYHGVSKGSGDYLFLKIIKKPDEVPGWFEEIFFDALQPHTRHHETDEVTLESGLVLNIRSILQQPKESNVQVSRLIKEGLFGKSYSWYYLHAEARCQRTIARFWEKGIIVDVDY
ncbi:hypothetical protein H2204_004074 [Knufia peltigerae]|uniref:Uncharacterized protein n=1 Tax=Knufia peltigerae TaxID=1002370 RepID=A0AA39CZX9_9EURO|nr:hypothetical protein H2204_004074 [Knufia peltigerae]